MTAPFIGFNQDLIGNDVQFFLNLTLNIFNVCAAQNATQGAFVHGMADAFAGPCNNF